MTVAVVGAGLAGLACASLLAESGCEVEVFEADERVGGRVLSVPDPSGDAWELGAQVIHSDGVPALARFGAVGVPPERTDLAIVLDGRPVRSWQLMARGIRPWEATAGLTGVGGSVARWIDDACPTPTARRVAHDWVSQEWACGTDALDAGETARWLTDRSAAGAAGLVIPAGLNSLTDRLTAGLTIHLAQPVDEVVVSPTGTGIRTGGTSTATDAVVVTVPPWLLRAPGERGGLVLRGVDPVALRTVAGMPGGDAVAVLITLRRPVPTSANVFDRRFGFVRCRRGSTRILAVSKGPGAAALRTAVNDPVPLTAALCAVLGLPNAGGVPADVRVVDWGRRPWTRGAFSAPTAQQRAARGALRSLERGGLVFAGEATRRDGTAARMHGALSSGVDAAHRMLTWLGRSRPPSRDGIPAARPIGAATGGITLGGST